MEQNSLDTTRFFEALAELNMMGIKFKTLTKIVCIGMQSAGKSSLSEALAGDGYGILQKVMGLRTKKPMHITTIRSEMIRYKVNDKEFNTELDARSEIDRLNQNNHINEIFITVHEPTVHNSHFTDLPGLFYGKDKETSKRVAEITKEYLRDKNSIIVVVHNASSDIATNKALSYVEQMNMVQSTIGVITKTDLIDSGSYEMVSELLNNTGEHGLGYGYCAVVLRNKQNLDSGMTIAQKMDEEDEFFQNNTSFQPSTVRRLRRAISQIQFQKIRENIPNLLQEIRVHVSKLESSLGFINNIIEDTDNQSCKKMATKIRVLIEKLVGDSIERAELEKSMFKQFRDEIMGCLASNYQCKHHFTPTFSQNTIPQTIYNNLRYGGLPTDECDTDDFKHLFDFGQTSPIIVTNDVINKAIKKELTVVNCANCFEFVTDDPQNKKRNEWMKRLDKFFSGLLNGNTIQDIVYSITSKNLVSYINKDNEDKEGNNTDGVAEKFTEYLVNEISHAVYEDKIKYSISSMINVERRANVSAFDLIRHLIKMYEEHFTFKNGVLFRYNLTNSSAKIIIETFGEPWTEAYLKAVSSKIAENCYRNVAVNLIEPMADKLLEMIIDMFQKNNAEREKTKLSSKISRLNELANIISEYTCA